MKQNSVEDQCSDMETEFHLKIPCRLAERVENYADANSTTITGVVIEALDTFLREQLGRSDR